MLLGWHCLLYLAEYIQGTISLFLVLQSVQFLLHYVDWTHAESYVDICAHSLPLSEAG